MSEAERICLEQLCIRTLQVLRAIIHNRIVRIPELKEGVEVPRAHKLAMKAVEDVQTALNVHGVALKVGGHHFNISQYLMSTFRLFLFCLIPMTILFARRWLCCRRLSIPAIVLFKRALKSISLV